MNRHLSILPVVIGTLLVAGCVRQRGWLLKPIPLDERLHETVVARDKGWFVSDKIVIVDVSGLLINDRRRGLFASGDNPVSLFIEKLDKAEGDDLVKAVLLRINSPGGGVTASDIMYRRLLAFRQRRKIPVVAVIEDIGASGAYYLACGADRIVAHPTSVVGSIGVMMQTVSVAGTMKMIGMEAKALTSGPYKDLANPLKPLNDKDLAILQDMVNVYHQQFLRVVKAGRPDLSGEKLKELADGRVFASDQAKARGLVDELTYMDGAVALAKGLSHVDKARVVIYHRPLGYRANVYSTAPAAPQINLINLSVPELLRTAQPQFLYLWTGRTYPG